MSEFDCIVIGGGIGGLCAAGRLAAEGVNVLLLEKNPTPGGYLQSFRRRGITFDSSVDCFSGFDARGPFTTLLRSLGVEDELSTVTVDPVRTSVFPGITVKVWSDVERYIEEIKRLFPGDAKGIESLFGVLRLVYSEIEEWADSITGMEET
ncbi:MAG: phytoene desaturase family protein, partial [Thermodesulfobacteriota bacterium]